LTDDTIHLAKRASFPAIVLKTLRRPFRRSSHTLALCSVQQQCKAHVRPCVKMRCLRQHCRMPANEHACCCKCTHTHMQQVPEVTQAALLVQFGSQHWPATQPAQPMPAKLTTTHCSRPSRQQCRHEIYNASAQAPIRLDQSHSICQ
jgi:hypothetical protein